MQLCKCQAEYQLINSSKVLYILNIVVKKLYLFYRKIQNIKKRGNCFIRKKDSQEVRSSIFLLVIRPRLAFIHC